MAGRVHMTSLVAVVMVVSQASAFVLPGLLGVAAYRASIPGAQFVDQIPKPLAPHRQFMPQDAIPGVLSGHGFGAVGGGVGMLGDGLGVVDPSGQASWDNVMIGGGLGAAGLGGGLGGGQIIVDGFDNPFDNMVVGGAGLGANNLMVSL